MFTGLKVATVLSMIGAIVGEYFGGPTEALGVKILNDSSYGNFTDAWAGIVMASLLGIVFYAVVALAERLDDELAPVGEGLPNGMTTRENGGSLTRGRNRMKHRWVVGIAVLACLVVAGGAAARTQLATSSKAAKDKGDPAAEVGHAGAVRAGTTPRRRRGTTRRPGST